MDNHIDCFVTFHTDLLLRDLKGFQVVAHNAQLLLKLHNFATHRKVKHKLVNKFYTNCVQLDLRWQKKNKNKKRISCGN